MLQELFASIINTVFQTAISRCAFSFFKFFCKYCKLRKKKKEKKVKCFCKPKVMQKEKILEPDACGLQNSKRVETEQKKFFFWF